MTVGLNNKIPMKPGFGRKLETPTFNKQSLSSTRGATNSDSANSTSLNRTSLRSSVSQNLSTAKLNTSYSSSLNSNTSVFGNRSTYTPGTHFLGTADYSRDRNDMRTGINTNSIGYDPQTKGYRSGKHDMELFTGGLTQRSELRAMKRAGMVDLSAVQDSSSGGSGKTSLLKKILIGVGIGAAVGGVGYGIYKLATKNKSDKTQGNESAMAQLNQLAQAQSKGDGKVKSVTNSSNAAKTTQVQSQPQTSKTVAGEDLGLKDDPVYNSLTEQETSLNTQMAETGNTLKSLNTQLSQSKQNESVSLMALNAAKDQVTLLEGQLSNSGLSDIQKQTIKDSLAKAQESVIQKQEQYDKAVQNSENLQADINSVTSEQNSIQEQLQSVTDEQAKIAQKYAGSADAANNDNNKSQQA